MKLVTSAEMRAIEQACAARGISTDQLMEAAGLAVAQEGWISLGVVMDRVIVLLCGPGNNGSDALVAGRTLKEWGGDVRAYLVGQRAEADEHAQALAATGVPVVRQEEDGGLEQLRRWLAEADLVIDGILGTGQRLPLRENVRAVLNGLSAVRAERPRPRLVAVDLPTGIEADSGRVDEHAVAADATVALGFAKAGLYLLPGADYAGRVEVIDIGIPAELVTDVRLELLDRRWARAHLPARPPHANKGTFGRVMVVAGSDSYPGAAYLACRGAGRAGAGLVTLAGTEFTVRAVAAGARETTYVVLPDEGGYLRPDAARLLDDELHGYDVLVLGPGLSRRPGVGEFVRGALGGVPEEVRGVVIDADGLNALAETKDWRRLARRDWVLTPHPGEMARLTAATVAEVQERRVELVREAAAEWGVVLVLKGANTVIAAPDGRVQLSPFATAALATAGTGDVLSGAIGGLLAQGMAPFEAAVLGVYLHGRAGELVAREIGIAGTLAGDVAEALPRAIKDLAGEL